MIDDELVFILVRKPGVAPGPSPSQGEMLLLQHDPDGEFKIADLRFEKADSQRRQIGNRKSKWCSHVDLHHEPPASQTGVQD